MKFDSKNGLDKYLSGQIEDFKGEKLEYERLKKNFGFKFNQVIYQLNKFYAIQNNLDESYQSALDLLGDLDVSKIQQAIKDNDELKYRIPA